MGATKMMKPEIKRMPIAELSDVAGLDADDLAEWLEDDPDYETEFCCIDDKFYYIYEMCDAVYCELVDAVVVYGHEEIMIVNAKGEHWKIYTR